MEEDIAVEDLLRDSNSDDSSECGNEKDGMFPSRCSFPLAILDPCA